MKKYDVIAIGTGSAMNIVDAMIRADSDIKAAVIDNDEPGGICLTRACIPTKLLIYPADVLRIIEGAKTFGINVGIRKVDFPRIMKRMRSIIGKDIKRIGSSLKRDANVDYFRATAVFTAPYRLEVGGESISSDMIILGLGSRPAVPPIKGLEETGFRTSDTILQLETLPPRLAIIGGGYVAAEYGHFFSAMGSEVTIIGRNPRFLPREEPEVSALALREMSGQMEVLTNQEVQEVKRVASGVRVLRVRDRTTRAGKEIPADEILVAAGRAPNTDLLHPERSGVQIDGHGWVVVDDYLQTTKHNIWALGDATGKHLYKHVANYESKVVYYNAVLGEKIKADYHAVPHAIFSHPEIAGVGLKEEEAVKKFGEDGILIGFSRYEDTARGQAMAVKDCFVKVIVKSEFSQIVGAHIIGPHASVLIQEIVNLMYTPERNIAPLTEGMHIHPALNEVVERAFTSLMSPHEYSHLLEDYGLREPGRRSPR